MTRCPDKARERRGEGKLITNSVMGFDSGSDSDSDSDSHAVERGSSPWWLQMHHVASRDMQISTLVDSVHPI